MKYPLNNLLWIEELLPAEIEAVPKHGGMAYYLENKLVLIVVERAGRLRDHKGVTYPFELWNGCILPIEKKRQNAFYLKLPLLENHPVNKNWLYSPSDSENFEDDVKLFVREVIKRNPLLGLEVKFMTRPKEQEPAKKVKKSPNKDVKADKKRENALITAMLNRKRT
ncbi:MAG: hypothetical protein H7326_05670 [Bdellovibrionaceae bacterium]|nr:hypothetical protein [Pseudobdellovibrionaceae bacterium]